MPRTPDRLYVHVGAPKTGTTYVQDRLALNRRALAVQHVHFPSGSALAEPTTFHFRAALDLLGQDWGGEAGHAAGAWDRFVRDARRRQGSVILSHEILATAKPWVIDKVRESFRGCEVHVVYSARDLGRQIPAAWQESVKQGRRWTYKRYLRKMRNDRSWFGRAFDIPGVLSRWSEGLPPEQVHLVTVPGPGTSPPKQELWHRMCRAFGIDPDWAPQDSARTNPSMGMAETQVLRLLNSELATYARGNSLEYDNLVRGLLAERTLAHRADSVPVLVPPRMYGWVDEKTEQWVEWVEQSGIDVVGSLDDLRAVWPIGENGGWVNPDRVSNKARLDAAVHALAAMTEEAMRRPDPDRATTKRLRAGLDRIVDRPQTHRPR